MDMPAAFFLIVLALQFAFTAAVVVLVARRYPARIRVYRLVAPAGVPVLLFAFATFAFVRIHQQVGIPATAMPIAPIARFALAYAVLWLVGLLWGTLLIRLIRR